jgi:hypothetical protein
LACFVKLCEGMTNLHYLHMCVLYIRAMFVRNRIIDRGKPFIAQPEIVPLNIFICAVLFRHDSYLIILVPCLSFLSEGEVQVQTNRKY